MRKIIAITQVTLDGVMQAPGGPEEDPRNGFIHGGWAMPFLDDDLSQAIGETIAGDFDMLLGRRTYEIFAPIGRTRATTRSPSRSTRRRNTSSRAASTVLTGRNRSVLIATLLRRSAS
jgi:dihydrofolate reductase